MKITLPSFSLKASLVILFLSTIFFAVVMPLRDFDIWFHVKSGEVMAKQGLIYHDVFSYTANGRDWAPYEWLFQVTTYYFSHFFGFES